jgi:hypothetical protein
MPECGYFRSPFVAGEVGVVYNLTSRARVDRARSPASLLAVCNVTSGSNSVVECDLAKVEVAGSNPVSRSKFRPGNISVPDQATK